jgi:hypothetical protein
MSKISKCIVLEVLRHTQIIVMAPPFRRPDKLIISTYQLTYVEN